MNYPDPYLQGFMQAMASEKKGTWVRHLFVDINEGNLSDAVAFSHISYVFSKLNSADDEQERNYVMSKSKIERRDGFEWLALPQSEWWQVCRINKNTIKAVLNRLADRGFIHTKRVQSAIDGKTRTIVRPDYERISEALRTKETPELSGSDSNPLDRIDLTLGSNRSNPLDRIDLTLGSNRSNPPYIQKDLRKEDLRKDLKDPERVREEPDFCGEVISCEIVSDSEPGSEPAQNSPLSIEVKPKDSSLCLGISHADDHPQPAPKIKTLVLAPQRLDNVLDRQLSRKGIDPADYTRFRGKYAPYANAVTVHGFGSDEYTHRAWLDLVKDGWKPDADFWRGLDLEVAWGLEIYKKTKEPLPGVPGGPAFLRSRRWIQAIDRDEVRSKLGSVGLDMHVEKSRDLVKEESFARMRAAIEAVRKKIELEQLNQQELEECHDF